MGSTLLAGSALKAVTGRAVAQPSLFRTCLTDADDSDQPDFGTRTGLNDSDGVDAAERGTLTGRTDADTSDVATRGRSWRCAVEGRTGISDSDSGELADPAGSGRGSGRRPTGVTDSDTGEGADRAGSGRGTGGRGPRPANAERVLPQFPWPPPRPSERTALPRARVLAALDSEPSLYDVGEHLLSGLERAGYTEHSFYAVPDGFALVARLERISDDGRPLPDAFRYMPPNEEPFSLSTYVSGLFVAPVGRYRQIVFVVTGRPFVATGEALTQRRSADILSGGVDFLPAGFRDLAFDQDHQISALIYEFDKAGQAPMRQLYSGRINARAHLVRSGLYAALVR